MMSSRLIRPTCPPKPACWNSTIPAVTASDIAKAQPDYTSVEGQTRVAVVFTDTGAKHFADLTTAQLHKGIVGGQWTPRADARGGSKDYGAREVIGGIL